MNNTLITIVIPCYNHGKYLEETIQSVLDSTDRYLVEIIVVNDGSTDFNTLEVFKKIEERGILVLHQDNQGLAKARNNGIKIAKGKYILPLDSDNKVCNSYLNEAVDILEKNEMFDIVYGDALYIGEKHGIWKNKPIDKKRMLFANQIDACALFRRSLWVEVNGYADDMPYMGNEDWNFWLRAINKQKVFFYLDKICFEYRVLSNSMIRTVPHDFESKTFAYNTSDLYNLYIGSMHEDYDKFQNIFYGGLFRKIIKLIANHFRLYKY